MSTHITNITGVKESEYDHNKKVNTELNLTRFLGGENGAMLQLNINNKDGYIQLTQDQVKILAETLSSSFNYDKFPSE